MKRFLLILALLGSVGTASYALPNKAEVIPAQGGNILITPIYHASMQIEYKGKVIQVDPFSAGDYTGAKKADVILITHSHADHFDEKAMEKVISKKFLHIIAPKSVVDVLSAPDDTLGVGNGGLRRLSYIPLKNGEGYDFNTESNGSDQKQLFHLEAVPMYNIVRGPKPGAKFHPKGEFNGYILTLGGKRIYIAGDTEATPEMKALKNIDVAFLPMNLPYTMTPQEAAVGARAFKPKVVYPYHYRYPFTKANDNPQQFAKAMAGSGVVVRIRDWYGHPAK